MDAHISKYCDDAMLSNPVYYTDAGNQVEFEKLAQDYVAFCDLNDLQEEFGLASEEEVTIRILEEVMNWWSKYPSAHKYREPQ